MTDPILRFPVTPLQPGGFSTLDVGALAAAAQRPNAPVGALLGDCKGGKPNTPLLITSPQLAKAVLRSGPLYDVARAFFAGGGSSLFGVRIGNGIAAATKSLAGAAGTPVILTANDFGTWTNGIKVTVAANNKVTVAFTDGFGVTYTENWAMGSSATAQQVVDAINGKAAGFTKSAYVTAALPPSGTNTMPLTAAAQAAMTGGADTGSVISGDWATGLTSIETKDVDLVGVATNDATVHAQLRAHCDTMSSVLARRERTSVVGVALAETDSQYVARAAALAAGRVQLVGPGIYLYDDAGNLTLYEPYVAAAGTMGEHCALPDPANALTHKVAAWIVDVERELSTAPGSSLDVLLAGGVTPLAPAEGGGIWYVDSLCTNLSVPLLADFHKIRTADECAKRLRRRLERRFVGPKTLDGTSQEIALEAAAEADEQVRTTLLRGRGTINVQEDPNDPRIQLVQVQVILPDTTKFILLTVALRPPNSSTVVTA